jgi:hypothetical protein
MVAVVLGTYHLVERPLGFGGQRALRTFGRARLIAATGIRAGTSKPNVIYLTSDFLLAHYHLRVGFGFSSEGVTNHRAGSRETFRKKLRRRDGIKSELQPFRSSMLKLDVTTISKRTSA